MPVGVLDRKCNQQQLTDKTSQFFPVHEPTRAEDGTNSSSLRIKMHWLA
jgi:hypothetical protein